MPQNVGPVLFDKPASSLFHNPNQTPWMLAFNGKLYAFLTAQLGQVNGANPHFYRSTDNGNTWTELDAANAPANVGDAFVCWDTANSRAIVCFNTRTAPTTALQLIQFSLVDGAESWGPAIAAGGPAAARSACVWGVFLRPDTTIAVVFDSGVSGVGDSRLHGTFWNGAAWSAPVDLGVNMPFNSGSVPACIVQPCSCLMDSTGMIHLFPVGVGAGQHNYWGYQQWNTDNTLGNFHVFGQGAAVFHDSRGTNMVLFNGNSLVLAITSDVPPFSARAQLNVFVGTPLANPVWTQSAPAVLTVAFANASSPTASFGVFGAGGSRAFSGALVSLNAGASTAAYLLNEEDIAPGPVIVCMLTQQDVNGFPFVQLVTSPDAVNWSILPTDINPNYNYYLGFSPVDPAVDMPPGGFLVPGLQVLAGAAAPAGGNITIGPTGGGGLRSGRAKGGDMNADDACVDRFSNLEYGALRRALARGLLCNPISNLQAANVVASQQEPIFKSAAIVAPAKGSVEFPVLNFDLEKGFAAILTGLAWNYVGANFVDGSGAIIWILMVDFRFVPGYSQIFQAFGDDQQPRPVVKGIPVGPGQNVQVLVSIPAASPVTVGGATQIFAAVSGVKFPVR